MPFDRRLRSGGFSGIWTLPSCETSEEPEEEGVRSERLGLENLDPEGLRVDFLRSAGKSCCGRPKRVVK